MNVAADFDDALICCVKFKLNNGLWIHVPHFMQAIIEK